MKQQRHAVIQELLVKTAVASQDELRRKLAGRGFHVTQATLSRDIHELRLNKGPAGYSLPAGPESDEDALPGISDLLESFGLEVRQRNEPPRPRNHNRKRATHRRRHRLRRLAGSRRHHRRRRHRPHHLPRRETGNSLEDSNRRLSWLTQQQSSPQNNRSSHSQQRAAHRHRRRRRLRRRQNSHACSSTIPDSQEQPQHFSVAPAKPKSPSPSRLEDLHPQLAMPGQTPRDRSLHLGARRRLRHRSPLPRDPARAIPRVGARRPSQHGIKVIDLSGAWRLQHDANRAVYKLHDADPEHAAAAPGRGRLRLPRTPSRRDRQRAPRRQPRLLRHLHHPRARASASGRPRRSRPRHHLRRQVRSQRSRQSADREDALHVRRRQSLRLRRLRPSPHRRAAGAARI